MNRPWWRGSVIYQIYPRSFMDANGDGVGDLPGILSQLEHVASLGVDAIWLSPIFPSPMADMGYDVSNYTDIDPLFGTLADFDALLERAHALGLKVMIDQVLSHTSDQHPWFEESKASCDGPKADWYVWADPQPDGSAPNNWPSVFGGSAWEWSVTRRQYYFHNFLKEQPDLNFHHPQVQDALLQTMRFWLERGVDGFRFDTVNFYFHDRELRNNPPAQRSESRPSVNPYDMQEHLYSKTRPENLAFLERIRALMDEFPDRTTVGEVGESHERSIPVMAEYTDGDHRLHMAYSFEMLQDHFSAQHFRQCVEQFFSIAHDGWPCWSFSNHDVIRHVTRWASHSSQRSQLARQTAALLLSLKGSVCLYQGEELGLPETELTFEELTDPPGIRFWPDYKGRDGCRTPIPWKQGAAPSGFTSGTPWLPVKPPHTDLSVEAQEADRNSTLAFYRTLLNFRKQHPELRHGEIRFFDLAEPLLAFTRTLDNHSLVALFNLSPQTQTVSLAGECALEGPSQNALAHEETLTLGPNGFAFMLPVWGITAIEVHPPR